ncbi:hypothetical protein CC85DRAFT_282607 [Cutaneotrichosporon oleaginosum]|uniref:DUF4267 domain-containing protein n=1 Tax=Cutaneotrichosporon oleaginosum TaxID=879819 RepID=A0A0J0XWU8_9TREE|nr:uncharacterized protein CC85DRAFT_282607 [Cutaneotrichosporon oleaginosum]KLT45523.1 hypothetical protein CC85DRAFT_282607 [Cutaneotrichosporon oleaginosum]TXT14522.1 hypothetical protein COLE_00715 [Cutaneotrichosporon oleaginosum]
MLPSSSNPVPWRPVCGLLGLFFTLGLKGVFQPLKGAQIFGLTQATDAQAAFYPVVSARNVSLGLCILAFTLTGQRRALGTLLLCFTAMCGVDLAFVLRIHNVQRGKIAMHAVKLVLFPVMAAKMLEWI